MDHYKRSNLTSYSTLYTPISDPSPNELIILCTWLGATPKPTSKYISIYKELTPRTPILHLAASVFTITPPYPIQQARMSAAVTVVQNTLSSSSRTPNKEQTKPAKILLHTFSNGGSNSATQLLLAYNSTTSLPLPLHAIICDSAPARGEYWKSYSSIQLSLPQTPLYTYILGPLAGHAILLGMYSGAAMGRYPVFETLIRETLIDERIVAGRKRIAYLWGKGDVVVDWRDVVGHGEEARGKGWEVKSVEFEGSGHVVHWVGGRERYEGAVREMWVG